MLKIGKLIAVFSVISTAALMAQSNESYLLYDAACIQKFDYERGQEYSDLAFWDYHLRVSPGKTLLFRVLKQEAYLDEIAALDKEPLRCNDPKIMDDSYIQDINAAKKSLSIAEYDKDKKNYRIYSVKKVIILNESNSGTDIIGEKLYFGKNTKAGDNIDSSGGRVLYMGNINIQCYKVQHFRAFDKAQPRFSEDYYIAEQLGLIKIVKDQGSLDLAYINGVDINDYLKSRCKVIPDPKPKTPKDTFALDSAGFYTVKSGDNLYRLATYFNTRVDIIMGLNNLKSDDLSLGQKLKIKDDGTYKDINPIMKKDEASGNTYKVHIVRQGEILQDIAQKYKTTVLSIMKLNNMEDTKIAIFQELIIEIIKD